MGSWNPSRMNLGGLETPSVIIDVAQARANAERMQQAVSSAGCRLRPHVKTHRTPFFAKMQLECGASGITCCKVSEAEVMASAGIDDIFIAYPMVGRARTLRALALSRRIRRLILAVDSLEGARQLDGLAWQEGLEVEVRLEIDTGAGRTGIQVDRALALARAIVSNMPSLRLTGIYTFKSLVLDGRPTDDNLQAAREEGSLMHEVASALRADGIAVEDVSAGSTPTGIEVARTGLVNEVRPGTYIFGDYMLTKEHACTLDDIAVRFIATVVSANHEDYAVIDGGTKCFPTDAPPFVPPFNYPGYAVVEGNEDLHLSRMNEEHGIITSDSGHTGLKVGQVITLIPIHVCTAINMQESVCFLEDGCFTRHPVEARGMLL